MTSKLLFGNCAELRSEKVDPKTSQESFYIGLEHIEQQTLSLVGHGYGSDVDSQKQRFYEGDILFGKLRPYFRKVVVAPFDGICSTDIWVVKPKAGVDRNFLFYWIASEEFIASSMNASEGGRMPRAKWDWVSKFQSESFTLDEQIAIGKSLRALDQKIAANNALSKTLEDIAQTIFKSWFIDFDPVKAKMAGEKPAGMDAATAALFPDSTVDSEIGLIPKGWSIASIGDVSNINGGKMLSREEFNPEGTFPIFGGAGVMGKTNKSNADGFVITVGRVGAYCGQFFYHRGSAWVNNNASRIIPKDDISGEWIYLFLKSFDIENIKKGAAQPFVSNSDLAKSKLMLPSVEVIQKFTEVVEPIFKQSENAKNQARLLSKLRDSLLPRLFSGELQIPDEMLAS